MRVLHFTSRINCMADNNDQNQPSNQQQKPDERPLDPSRDVADIIGDTTGMTGVTVGSAHAGSAEPKDPYTDDNKQHLPGGIEEGGTASPIGEVEEERYGDEAYKQSVVSGMSQAAADVIEDKATEPRENLEQNQQQQENVGYPNFSPNSSLTDGSIKDTVKEGSYQEEDIDNINNQTDVNLRNAPGDDSPNSNVINTETAPYHGSENLGESSASGTTPDPTADDDVEKNANLMGQQLNKADGQEEVDISRDIDSEENDLQTH